MPDTKSMPHSIEAEEGVLGSLVIDGSAISKIISFLKPEHFYYSQNAEIFSSCVALYGRSESIDEITICQELVYREKLEQCGGAANLSRLVSICPTALDIENYAMIVLRLALNRQLIEAGNEIVGIGYEARPNFSESISDAEQSLFSIETQDDNRDLIHIREVLSEYLEPHSVSQDGQPMSFILTGLIDVDNILGGIQRTDLTIVAGRPGAGKTSLALAIARNVALDSKGCVAIFSLEMAREELVVRLMSSESGVNSRRFGFWNKEEIIRSEDEDSRLMKSVEILSEAQIYIDDSPYMRVSEMRSKLRKFQHDHKLDLIIVDHLGLMQADTDNNNRVNEVSYITKKLKGIARELKVPVVALSQLSRATEHRDDPKPRLSDLRDSGSLEQDSDNVLFIFRESYYYTPEQWRIMFPNTPYPEKEADIIIGKHRNGPMGEVKVYFDRNLVKFSNLQKKDNYNLI